MTLNKVYCEEGGRTILTSNEISATDQLKSRVSTHNLFYYFVCLWKQSTIMAYFFTKFYLTNSQKGQGHNINSVLIESALQSRFHFS